LRFILSISGSFIIMIGAAVLLYWFARRKRITTQAHNGAKVQN
jgi:hypothetical protein